MGFLSDIFDPGAKDRDAATAAANAGVIDSSSFSGPGGVSGSFNFDENGGTSTTSLGSFNPILGGFQNMTQQGFAQAGGGLPPALSGLAQNTIDTLGTSNFQQMSGQGDYNDLGNIFQSAMPIATADPFALGSYVTEKLSSLSERANQRLVNKTFDRLKASGRLGTTGGANIAGQLDANLSDQADKQALMGLEAGQGMQRDAFGRVIQSGAGREAIGNRTFQESMGINQFQNQSALNQWNVGSDAFTQFLNSQRQGADIAFNANNGSINTANIPLSFQAAAMNNSATASNSNFDAAGVHQQNAAMAQSPWLNALTTVGSLAGGIATGGLSTMAKGLIDNFMPAVGGTGGTTPGSFM